MLSNRIQLLAGRILLTAAFVGMWQVVVKSNPDWVFFLASPETVLAAAKELLASWETYEDVFTTTAEATSGLLIGTALGAGCGLLLSQFPRSGTLIMPLVMAIGAFPVLALAPIAILWFGIGFGMKVALAVFCTYFIAFGQAFRGAQSVNSKHIDFLAGMGASSRQLFAKVVVPGATESVLNSMRINIGFALLGAFVGEFISSDRGLGHLILRASSLYDVPRALAGSLLAVMVAAALDGTAKALESRRYDLIQLIAVPHGIWDRPQKQSGAKLGRGLLTFRLANLRNWLKK